MCGLTAADLLADLEKIKRELERGDASSSQTAINPQTNVREIHRLTLRPDASHRRHQIWIALVGVVLARIPLLS